MVRELQPLLLMKSTPLPSSSTAAYCQARKKPKVDVFEVIFQHTADRLRPVMNSNVLQSRRVIVVDEAMPDTEVQYGLSESLAFQTLKEELHVHHEKK